MLVEISAGAVVFRQEIGSARLYLLLQYGGHHWDFPKGNVEKNETAEVTARREIAEETGIQDIKFIPGFAEKISYFYRRNRQTVSKEVMFLLAETRTSKVILSFEHIGSEWLDYNKAYERLIYRNAKTILEKAERFLSTQE